MNSLRTSHRELARITTTALALALGAGLALAGPPAPDRDATRAFYTAPPTIPHPLRGAQERNQKSCLGCHQKVRKMGSRVTVPVPHGESFGNCLQCHVEASPAAWKVLARPPVNDFVRLEEPRVGTRLKPKAPPTMPHRLFLRENCVTCHAGDHPNPAMRSPHPDRKNCEKCHKPGGAEF